MKISLCALSDQQYIEQILREISNIIRALMRLLPAHGVSVNFIHWWKIYLFSPVSSFFFHLLISRIILVRQSCLHADKIKGGMFVCRLFLCINSIAMFADVLPSSSWNHLSSGGAFVSCVTDHLQILEFFIRNHWNCKNTKWFRMSLISQRELPLKTNINSLMLNSRELKAGSK